VETTVAIELAASWKPLMKSKRRATMTMKTTRVSMRAGRAQAILRMIPSMTFRHVLTAVGHDLHRLVDLLPLDDLDGSLCSSKSAARLSRQQVVGAVLQPVHLHRVLVEAGVHVAQAADRPVHRLRRLHDDVGHGRQAEVGSLMR